MPSRLLPTSIHWQQVWGLAAILAAVTLSWMAYGFYQPKILQNLGFVQLAAWLGILQGFLGAILEPWVGQAADQFQHRFGSRLPFITVGVALAGLLFVSIALLLQWQLPPALRGVIPVLMTLWVMAMIVFRGPVIALLRQAAPLAELPKANSVLTVVFGIVVALEPLLETLLQRVGASVTFLLGAIALTVGAAFLYQSVPNSRLYAPASLKPSWVSRHQQGILFGLGFGVGLDVNLLLRFLPPNLSPHPSGLSSPEITSTLLLITALTAIPLGMWTTPAKVKPAMVLGLGGMVLSLGLLGLSPTGLGAWVLIVLAGTSFSLVFESQIPLTLQLVPSDRAGLGTGLYFGGMGAATACTSLLLNQTSPLSTLAAFGISLLTLCCLTLPCLLIARSPAP